MAENANPTTQPLALAVIEEKTITPSPTPKEEKNQKPGIMIKQAKSISMQRIMFLLTIISFLLSLPILFCIIWLLYMKVCDCADLLQLSKVQGGVVAALIFLFLISNAVVFLRSRFPMLGLMLVMVPLILILTMGLALVGAYSIESETIPGTSKWLKMEVNRDGNWNNIKSCIYDTRMCQDLAARSFMVKSYDFSMSKFSPIESGCCMPPAACDMEYVNATYWTRGREGGRSGGSYNVDCDLWQNNEATLCYDCQCCKEGFITVLHGKWFKLGTFLVVTTILLMVSHLLLFIGTTWERYAS